MLMTACGITDTGLQRSHNEDAFCVDHEIGLLAVADGLGGRAGGEVASQLVIQELREHLEMGKSQSSCDCGIEVLAKASEVANSAILEMVARKPELRGMGTTLTACLITGKSCHFVHIGDSRGYLLRGGMMIQLTEDHTVRSLRGLDRIACEHDGSDKLLVALGTSKWVSADLFTEELEAGDLLLLCTDGLSTELGTEELAAIVQRPLSLEDRCAALVNLARERGGSDNITVVLAEIQKP
jgi:protein phosphatase